MRRSLTLFQKTAEKPSATSGTSGNVIFAGFLGLAGVVTGSVVHFFGNAAKNPQKGPSPTHLTPGMSKD